MNIIRSLQRKTECPFFYDYKTVQQALRFMRSHGCVQVPVVNQDGRYLGTAKVISYGISSTGAAMRRQRITKLPSCCAAARRRP